MPVANRREQTMTLKVLTWNVEWAGPRSRRAPEIRNRINAHTPDVICLTEANVHLLSEPGHIICSQPDAGYKVIANRRKVILWSREPWYQVDNFGIESMPPGRFIAGVTQTSLGKITVLGICIPWFGSRTQALFGTQHKKQWEDHEQYLVGLTEVLRRSPSERLIVMGDFNQKIGPDSRAPRPLQSALQKAFSPTLTIATTDVAFRGKKSIDHIAVSRDWTVKSLDVISNIHQVRNLSDHFGIAAELSFHDA